MPGKVSGLPGTEPEGRNYPRLAAADDKGKLTLPWIAGDKGLIYSRHSTQYFEMERRLPELYELYPDLNSIPPMWLKDYRSYHPSTRKEMVEKAIEWKTMLQPQEWDRLPGSATQASGNQRNVVHDGA